MPAFGSNSVCCAFARKVLYEPTKGFRLSDRIVSAIDRFIGALSRFIVPGQPGVMSRWLFIYPFVGGADWTHALNLADAPGAGYGIPGTTGNFEKFRMTWSGVVTHNQNGVTFPSGGSGSTNCDMADATNNYYAWNRKSHGFYSRTNSAVADYTMGVGLTEPRNGYYYQQGIHARFTDGNCYADLVYYAKTGVTTVPNRNTVAVADSLGLYSDSQRGPYGGVAHYLFKRGAYIAGDNSPEIGFGYGTGPPSYMAIVGTRNLSFLFSTKHTKVLQGTVNSDGTGGYMPGDNVDFNLFVEQLQVALTRAV